MTICSLTFSSAKPPPFCFASQQLQLRANMEEEKNHHEHDEEFNAALSKGKKKLSLESYYNALASGDYNVLTIPQLNQILSIHGYKRLIKSKKIEVVEAVRTIDLKSFSRSTLGESVQPAPMSLNDVIKDLTELNWQTYPVVSVKSIDSTHYSNTAFSTCNPNASGVDPTGLKSEKKKKTETGSASNRSGEQACSVVNESSSTCAPMAVIAQNNISCVQIGVMASGGGDNSGDRKEYGPVTIGTSCSSSAMADEIPMPENKKKRKLDKKSMEDLLSRSI